MQKDLKSKFLSTFESGAQFIKKGQFQKALEKYSKAHQIALKLADPTLIHKSSANLSLALIELGEYKKAEKGLREIIMSSQDDTVIFSASYSLAISLRKQGKYQSALKFASMALQKSTDMKHLDAQAKAHNLIGNIHLFQNYIGKALEKYLKALEIREKEIGDNSFSLAILKENIGYCYILQKDFKTGIKLIKKALQIAKTIGDARCASDCHQDLSYAYMLMRKLDLAEKMGEGALHLAIENGYKDVEKNCYYLLGEINFLKGNSGKMDSYFQKLQDLYPHLPFLKEFLSEFDVSNFITLKQL
jgi:tetratricopeptide (TPR) repeat protein